MVVGKAAVTPSIVLLRLRDPDGRPLPGWSPGSHLDLVLPNGLVRPYSLCGRTDERREWRILVRREEASRGGSAYVHDHLDAGDLVEYRGPSAWFRLAPAGRYLFLAGGVGVAPLLPLARLAGAVLRPWSMTVFGKDGAALTSIDGIDDLKPNITMAPQHSGRDALDAVLSGIEDGTAVYACGPGPFAEAVERALRDRPEVTLHHQSFGLAVGSKGGEPVELVLARSGLAFAVAAGTSLHEGLRAMGVHVPLSCGAGFCGACLVRVLDGTPDHRDRLLTQAQRDRGDVILTCVSRAATPRLVLDL